MPRLARKNIETPYIHVMVQGINKEYIFDDKRFLKQYLKHVLDNSSNDSFTLLAYCMMSNHAHFLFYVKEFEKFEKHMHLINLKFAQSYNKAKHRFGVVFRNRYQIEPIYDEYYLMNCIKYIHQNPVKAGMVKKCEDYPYSSYIDYLHETGIVKNETVKSILGKHVNYLELIENSFDRIFLDWKEDIEIESYIDAGIAEFVKKFHYRLIDVFTNKVVLNSLIIFLKKEGNIKYTAAIKYLGMSNQVLKNLRKMDKTN